MAELLLEEKTEVDPLIEHEFTVKVNSGEAIRKGQIRWCNLSGLDDNGKKIHKTRPCIIFQTDLYNSFEGSEIFVVPLSGCTEYILEEDDRYVFSFDSDIKDNNYKRSYVCFNRMTFINVGRVDKYIGECPKAVMRVINDYIYSRLGLVAPKKQRRKTNDNK